MANAMMCIREFGISKIRVFWHTYTPN